MHEVEHRDRAGVDVRHRDPGGRVGGAVHLHDPRLRVRRHRGGEDQVDRMEVLVPTRRRRAREVHVVHVDQLADLTLEPALLGDLTHHAILLLEKPRMQFSYDSDPKQAADTRVKLLDMIAANKTPVMSYHFNWPGFGNSAKTSDGFH